MRAIVGIRGEGRQIEQTEDGARPTVWFDSLRQVAGVLSEENRALLRIIEQHHPRTVLELSSLSGRAPSNLSRTLKTLEEHGLVRLHRSSESRAVRPEAVSTEFLILVG